MASVSTPLECSSSFLDLCFFHITKEGRLPWRNPVAVLTEMIVTWYTLRLNNWKFALREAEDQNFRPLLALSPHYWGPWPSLDDIFCSGAFNLIRDGEYNVHTKEYEANDGLECPCLTCLEQRFPTLEKLMYHEQARYSVLLKQEEDISEEFLPPPFVAMYPALVPTLITEWNSFNTYSRRLSRHSAIFNKYSKTISMELHNTFDVLCNHPDTLLQWIQEADQLPLVKDGLIEILAPVCLCISQLLQGEDHKFENHERRNSVRRYFRALMSTIATAMSREIPQDDETQGQVEDTCSEVSPLPIEAVILSEIPLHRPQKGQCFHILDHLGSYHPVTENEWLEDYLRLLSVLKEEQTARIIDNACRSHDEEKAQNGELAQAFEHVQYFLTSLPWTGSAAMPPVRGHCLPEPGFHFESLVCAVQEYFLTFDACAGSEGERGTILAFGEALITYVQSSLLTERLELSESRSSAFVPHRDKRQDTPLSSTLRYVRDLCEDPSYSTRKSTDDSQSHDNNYKRLSSCISAALENSGISRNASGDLAIVLEHCATQMALEIKHKITDRELNTDAAMRRLILNRMFALNAPYLSSENIQLQHLSLDKLMKTILQHLQETTRQLPVVSLLSNDFDRSTTSFHPFDQSNDRVERFPIRNKCLDAEKYLAFLQTGEGADKWDIRGEDFGPALLSFGNDLYSSLVFSDPWEVDNPIPHDNTKYDRGDSVIHSRTMVMNIDFPDIATIVLFDPSINLSMLENPQVQDQESESEPEFQDDMQETELDEEMDDDEDLPDPFDDGDTEPEDEVPLERSPGRTASYSDTIRMPTDVNELLPPEWIDVKELCTAPLDDPTIEESLEAEDKLIEEMLERLSEVVCLQNFYSSIESEKILDSASTFDHALHFIATVQYLRAQKKRYNELDTFPLVIATMQTHFTSIWESFWQDVPPMESFKIHDHGFDMRYFLTLSPDMVDPHSEEESGTRSKKEGSENQMNFLENGEVTHGRSRNQVALPESERDAWAILELGKYAKKNKKKRRGWERWYTHGWSRPLAEVLNDSDAPAQDSESQLGCRPSTVRNRVYYEPIGPDGPFSHLHGLYNEEDMDEEVENYKHFDDSDVMSAAKYSRELLHLPIDILEASKECIGVDLEGMLSLYDANEEAMNEDGETENVEMDYDQFVGFELEVPNPMRFECEDPGAGVSGSDMPGTESSDFDNSDSHDEDQENYDSEDSCSESEYCVDSVSGEEGDILNELFADSSSSDGEEVYTEQENQVGPYNNISLEDEVENASNSDDDDNDDDETEDDIDDVDVTTSNNATMDSEYDSFSDDYGSENSDDDDNHEQTVHFSQHESYESEADKDFEEEQSVSPVIQRIEESCDDSCDDSSDEDMDALSASTSESDYDSDDSGEEIELDGAFFFDSDVDSNEESSSPRLISRNDSDEEPFESGSECDFHEEEKWEHEDDKVPIDPPHSQGMGGLFEALREDDHDQASIASDPEVYVSHGDNDMDQNIEVSEKRFEEQESNGSEEDSPTDRESKEDDESKQKIVPAANPAPPHHNQESFIPEFLLQARPRRSRAVASYSEEALFLRALGDSDQETRSSEKRWQRSSAKEVEQFQFSSDESEGPNDDSDEEYIVKDAESSSDEDEGEVLQASSDESEANEEEDKDDSEEEDWASAKSRNSMRGSRANGGVKKQVHRSQGASRYVHRLGDDTDSLGAGEGKRNNRGKSSEIKILPEEEYRELYEIEIVDGGKRKLRCRIGTCNQQYSRIDRFYYHTLKEHQVIKENIVYYICGEHNCEFSTTHVWKFKRHQYSAHKIIEKVTKVLKCNVKSCRYSTAVKIELKRHHYDVHGIKEKGMKIFKCSVDECGLSYSDKFEYHKHLFKSHGIQPEGAIVHKCTTKGCEYATLNISHFNRHLESCRK